MGILISNLSSTTNIANSDSLILDQSDKTVKITLDELSTHFSLTELQADVELNDLAAIDDYTVIGNVSGASAKPTSISILDDPTLSANSSTSLVTQSSVKSYIDTIASQIGETGGGDASGYTVFIGGTLSDIPENNNKLLTQLAIVNYVKRDGYIQPSQLSTGAPVWDPNGYVTLGAQGVNNNHLVTKGYVDSVVPSGGVGGSSLLKYGEIAAGSVYGPAATADPSPTTSGDFTTVRAQGVNEDDSTFTCTFKTPLTNANYNVILELVSNSDDTLDFDNEINYVILSKSSTGFSFNIERFSSNSAVINQLPADPNININVRIESTAASAVTTSQEWEAVNYVFGSTYTNSTGSPLLINGFGTSAVGTNLSTNVIINEGLANEISLPFVHNWGDATTIGGNQASVTIPNGATYKFEYDPNDNTPATSFFWQQMTTIAVTGSVINGAEGPVGPTGPQGPAAAIYTLAGSVLTITTP